LTYNLQGIFEMGYENPSPI
jgi:ATP-dependent RNA helicase DDX6/DHH1